MEYIKLLHDLLGVSFFIFDYRGYGQSSGRPSEDGLYQDARDALAYLQSRDDVNPERIVYYGKSLGAAVASYLASQEAPYRLDFGIYAFTSTPDMAREIYPFLPLRPLLYTRYSNRDHLASVHAPVLIIHGTAIARYRCNTRTPCTQSPTSPNSSTSCAARATTTSISMEASSTLKSSRSFSACRWRHLEHKARDLVLANAVLAERAAAPNERPKPLNKCRGTTCRAPTFRARSCPSQRM